MKCLAVFIVIAIPGSSAMIAWTPKVGSVYKFIQRGSIHDPSKGSGIKDLTMEMSASETVERVAADGGVTLTEERVPIKVIVDGHDLTKSVSGHPMAPFKVVRKSNGEEEEVAADPLKFGFQIEGMDAVIYPGRTVEPGETWTYTAIGDPAKNTASCKKVFVYRGQEKVDGVLSNRVDYEVEEIGSPSPASGYGTAWLSAEDGELVKKRFHARNVRLKVTEAGVVDYSLSMDRTL